MQHEAEKIIGDPESPEVPRLGAEISKPVYALYGLTPEEIGILESQR